MDDDVFPQADTAVKLEAFRDCPNVVNLQAGCSFCCPHCCSMTGARLKGENSNKCDSVTLRCMHTNMFIGPEQLMKMDDRKINRSIDDNQLITVD